MNARSTANFALFSLALMFSSGSLAGIFDRDDRIPLYSSPNGQELNPDTGLGSGTASALRAVGGILCKDGSHSTAFLVDVSSMLKESVDQLLIIASASHVFFDSRGISRGKCWFRQNEWDFYAVRAMRIGAPRTGDADPRDWAFAVVAGMTSLGKSIDASSKLEIDFTDRYDFDRDQASSGDFLNVTFMPMHGMVGVATNCKPDDKRKYSWFRESHHDWSKMIIHDCDFLRAGSGGPLLFRKPNGFKVIGFNVGDADPSKKYTAEFSGATFDPPRSFNYSRGFDAGLRHQLRHFLEELVDADALLVDTP